MVVPPTIVELTPEDPVTAEFVEPPPPAPIVTVIAEPIVTE
jgi:hypothetical protein